MDKKKNDLIVHADSNQRITYANRTYCEEFGVSEEEVVGYDFKQLVHPEDIQRIVKSLKLLKVPPHLTYHEERAKTVHGWKWFAWTVKANIDDSGHVSEIKAVGRNVTKVKKEQEELFKKNIRIEKVLKVGKLSNQGLKLETVLKNILKGTVNALNASTGMIFLKDDSTGYLNWGESVGLSNAFIDDFKKQPIQPGEGLSGRIVQTGEPIYIQTGSSHDPRIIRQVVIDENFNSFIGVPIFALEQIIGVMNILTRPPETLSDDDLSICAAIGTNVGMAVRNAHLYEKKIEAEKALKKSEKKYRHLVQHAPAGLYEIDFINNKFITVNDVACQYTGYTEKELLEMSPAELLAPMSSKHFLERLRKMFVGEKVPPNVEYQIKKKNGGTLWADLKVKFTYDGNTVTGATVVAHDITDRRRAEAELRKSEKKYRKLYEDAAIGIFHSSFEGRFLDVNPALAKMLGYEKPQEVVDSITSIAEQIYVEPPVRDEVIAQALAKGETIKVENLYRRKDGSEWNAYLHLRHLCDSTGQPICLEGFVEDITDRKLAEEALKESKAFLENMTDIAYMADDRGNILWVNPAVERVTGLSPNEIIGKPFVPLFIEADHASLIDVYKRTLSGESLENTLTFKSGITCHFSSLPKRNLRGDIVGTFGVARDISERQAAERALQTSEARLKKAQTMAKIGSWEWDVQHDRAYWSEELFRIFGRDPAEGAPPFAEQSEFYANGDMQRLKEAVEICIQRGTPYEIELRAIRADGEIRHCVSRGQAQFDENGKVHRLVGSFQDITERKKMELALKESEERFKALHNASFGGIAIHDKGLILECNKGLTEITGYPYDELIGMDGLSLISDDTRAKVVRNIAADDERPYEATGVRKNGERYPIRLEARNIPYKGKHVRVVEFRDISENKRAEKEKEELEGRLRQAQKMEAVGRLAGGVAHDFNNMLSVIIGNAGLAMEDVDPSQPIYERLQEIREAGERSADLTRQLLAFARKQTVSPKVLDINKTVGSISSMLQRLMGEDVDLLWRPGKKVWPVRMDPSQIDQILANLCVNARDAIADVGKVTIETSNGAFDEAYCSDHPEFNPGEYVLLAVSDNGCGMDAETRENIFEPFFTTKDAGKGTGLGLATVYGVVKQNDGFVNVYSEPNQGATFKIYLPRYKAQTDLLTKDEKSITAELGNETVLLVEDEIAILRMTTQMLERLGYNVVAARTPGEAIELAQSHTGEIHLLVTDVVMPEMNGRDLAKNILSIHPNLKRLFMSGYTANVIAHHGILDKGVNFIQKPFSRGQLGEKVREALDGGEAKSRT